MKWICGVIVMIGVYFSSCKNSPNVAEDASPGAVGPSKAVDSMKSVALGTNNSPTGTLNKTDTVPKITNPMVDTLPRKNP